MKSRYDMFIKGDMKIGDDITYRVSKNSRLVYFGTILSFKKDKIKVKNYSFCNLAGLVIETYIDKEDIIKK